MFLMLLILLLIKMFLKVSIVMHYCCFDGIVAVVVDDVAVNGPDFIPSFHSPTQNRLINKQQISEAVR